jgi:hypothetical protein
MFVDCMFILPGWLQKIIVYVDNVWQIVRFGPSAIHGLEKEWLLCYCQYAEIEHAAKQGQPCPSDHPLLYYVSKLHSLALPLHSSSTIDCLSARVPLPSP